MRGSRPRSGAQGPPRSSRVGSGAQRGLTLVPMTIYFTDRGKIKLELGLARGKTFADKRSDMKKRDHKREMDRAMGRSR